MKTQVHNYTSRFKQVLLGLLLLISNSVFTQAQYGVGIMSTCYQSIQGSLTSDTEVKLLNHPNNRWVTLGSTNHLDITVFDVSYWDEVLETFEYFTTVDITQSNTINLSGFDTWKIRPHDNPGSGPGFDVNSFLIDFVDFEYSFMITPNYGGQGPPPTTTYHENCIEFGSNHDIEFNHNLTGLCHPPDITLRMNTTEDPTQYGLPPIIEITIPEAGDKIYNLTLPEMSAEGCVEAHGIGENNEPFIIYRCIPFDLEFKIKSCVEDDPNCPDLTITQEIEICCDCVDDPGSTGGGGCNPCD
jgi:hypothetical protein